MQGESREELSPCDPMRGVFSQERRCKDGVLGAWYADVFPGFIGKCSDLITGDAGPDDVAGLILTGSFASCEGSIIMLGGCPVFLSDIDILLVVSSAAAHAEIYPRRLAIGKRCEQLLPDALFVGRIDVGVMTTGELAGMPRSPGVFDIRESGVLLQGDDGLLERFPSFEAGDIGPGEALRLIENRIAAFLGCWPSGDRPEGIELYRFLYGISRVYTDILTASLCARGFYRKGYISRSRLLSPVNGVSDLRGDLGPAIADAAVRWTGFKIDPAAETFWSGEDRARRLWLEAAGAVLAARDRISLMDRKANGGGGPRKRDLLRAWNAACRDIPVARRIKLALSSLVTGRMPDEVIRKESVRLLRHAVESCTSGVVGSARGGFPHGTTSWDDAASMTWAEWNRLVMGRVESNGR